MKRTSLILSILLLFACTNEDNLVKTNENYLVKRDNEVLWNFDQRDGVLYLANSQTPFTGCFIHYEAPEQDFFRGCAVDGKLHGVYEKHWFNGQLKYRQESKHGELHGAMEFFYQNGDLKLREHYRNGEKHGIHEWYDYDQDRTLLYYSCYQNDEIVDESHCK